MPEIRLIDANALLNNLKASAKAAREWREETQDEEIKIRAEQAFGTFVECALRVKNAPTIEAEPVRRGHWMFLEQKSGYLWKCSNCKGNFEQRFSYCPYCGAVMEGGADNG